MGQHANCALDHSFDDGNVLVVGGGSKQPKSEAAAKATYTAQNIQLKVIQGVRLRRLLGYVGMVAVILSLSM